MYETGFADSESDRQSAVSTGLGVSNFLTFDGLFILLSGCVT